MAALGLHCYSGFLWLQWARVTFHRSVWASHGSGFSCCGAQILGSQAPVLSAWKFSSCSSWALELRLNSCDPWAYLLLGITMWTIFKSLYWICYNSFYFMIRNFGSEAYRILAPQPGFKPAPPALEGEVLSTGPPGKTQYSSVLRETGIEREREEHFDRESYSQTQERKSVSGGNSVWKQNVFSESVVAMEIMLSDGLL